MGSGPISARTSDTTRARSPLFPRTGKILWCLLGVFAPGDPFEGTVPRDMPILLPSGPGRVGARKPHAHGTLVSHQLFLQGIGAGSLFGAVSPSCPLPLIWYSCKSRIWASPLLALPREAVPAAPSQASHEGYGWVSSKLLPHVQSCFPCPKQLSGFRPPKALVLLGERKAVSSSSVQTDLERLEKVQRRVQEITLMSGNAPDPLKVCRNEDEGDFLQMCKCLLVMYPMLKGR